MCDEDDGRARGAEESSGEESTPASECEVEAERMGGAEDLSPSRRQVLIAAVAAGGGGLLMTLEGCAAGRPTSTPPEHVESVATTQASGTANVRLRVNGQDVALELEPRVTLLDALREYAGMTGTKKGCDHGQCGACTVLVDERRINSCLTLAIMHQGREITTIEGLSRGDELHPMQAAFIERDAFQCGYCTPGQICSAVGLMKEGHAHTDDEIREQMAGNICRCGAYVNIVSAIRQVMGEAAR